MTYADVVDRPMTDQTPEARRWHEVSEMGAHIGGGCDTPKECIREIAPTLAADLALAAAVRGDLEVYGTACLTRRADGSVERIPPEMVRLDVQAAKEAERE
jgi:hypothetical protein